MAAASFPPSPGNEHSPLVLLYQQAVLLLSSKPAELTVSCLAGNSAREPVWSRSLPSRREKALLQEVPDFVAIGTRRLGRVDSAISTFGIEASIFTG